MNYNNMAMKAAGAGALVVVIGLEALACTSPPTPSATPTLPAQTQTLETRLYGKVSYSLQKVETPQGPIETYVASMLSPDGKNMWSVSLDMSGAIDYTSRVTGGELNATARDFNFKHLATVQNFNEPFVSGLDAVVISMSHKDYYPAMAFVLDAKTGKEMGQVFSPGNITGVKYIAAMETELGYRNALVFTAFSNVAEILEEVSKMTNTPRKDVPFLPVAMVVDPNTFQVFSYKLLSLKPGEADEPSRDGDYFTYRLFTKGVSGATQRKILLYDLATPEAMLLASEYSSLFSLPKPSKMSNIISSHAPLSPRQLRQRSEMEMGRRRASMKARARA